MTLLPFNAACSFRENVTYVLFDAPAGLAVRSVEIAQRVELLGPSSAEALSISLAST